VADLKTPQLEHGHTRIANELLTHLAAYLHGRGSQLAIMLVVMRYSYGYSRKEAYLTISEIARHLGADRSNVKRAVKSLVEAQVLTVADWKGHHRKRYRVQKDWRRWVGHYDTWVKMTHGLSGPQGGVKMTHVGGSSGPPSKKKKKITKKGGGWVLAEDEE
jgi:phage replication O-like protein O